MNAIRFFLMAVFLTSSLAHAGLPDMPEMPVTLPDSIRQPLIAKRQPLAERKLALIGVGKTINQSCANVEKGSSQHQNCLAKQAQFNEDVEALSIEMDMLGDEVHAAVRTHTINSMSALAKHLRWSAEEQARLARELEALDKDGTPGTTGRETYEAWVSMKARENDPDLIREAAKAGGAGFPGAGTQSTNDCTIFALANATGLPYGVAAARANKLIGEGQWRDPVERANPETVFKKGLNGYEVIMLAEAFGQAKVVPSSAFSATLNEGHPILLGVILIQKREDNMYSQGFHEVVLTKTFQYKGETWYEMMDSNQPVTVRSHLTAKELGVIMFENGVEFRPDPGTTPKLLRKP